MEFDWIKFINEKIAVTWNTEEEINDFLRQCENLNLNWINCKATEFIPISNCIIFNICFDDHNLVFSSKEVLNKCGYKIVNWSDYMNDKIKIVLDEGAKMPTKARSTDAGFDLYAPIDFEVPATKSSKEKSYNIGGAMFAMNDDNVEIGSATIDTGVHIELPKSTVGMIKSKSGLNVKHSLIAEGVIDVGYTGSIVVKMYNLSSKPYYFKKGDKITQLVIMPIVEKELVQVDKLEETERGNGGFGSTGK